MTRYYAAKRWVAMKRKARKTAALKTKKAVYTRPPVIANYAERAITIGDLSLDVRQDDPMTGYARDHFGPNLSCMINGEQDTPRDTALLQYGTNVRTRGKAIVSGQWVCLYTGNIFTHPSQLQIDHIVPLAEAWRSGAQRWTQEERVAFARDPQNLIPVGAEINQAKSDGDISRWVPQENLAEYVIMWLTIKDKYRLAVDPREADMLHNWGLLGP